MSEPVGDVPAPLSSTEVSRQRAERIALAQDAAYKANRAAQADAKVSHFDADLEERRNWALTEARKSHVARQVGGEPHLVAWVNRDGSTNLGVDPHNPHRTTATTVYTAQPVIAGECERLTDEDVARIERRQRVAECVLLAGKYDLAVCLDAGYMTPEEARLPEVQAAARELARRPVPEDSPPYNVVNSVAG